MKGRCACGQVTVELAIGPEYINFCNCSLCSKSGGAWCYCGKAEVTITGWTSAYIRSDIPKPSVELHFCATCGATTHWVPAGEPNIDRMGINVRLFEPDELAGVEARFPDGRSWDGSTDYAYRRPHEPFDPARHA